MLLFLNSSVKYWRQYYGEVSKTRPTVVLPTSPQYCSYITL